MTIKMIFDAGDREDARQASATAIDASWKKIKEECQKAIDNDSKEVDNAVAGIKGIKVNCKKNIDLARTQLRAKTDSINDQIGEIDSDLAKVRDLGDLALQLVDGRVQQWTSVIDRMDTVTQSIDTLGIDGWKGNDAVAYRANVARQKSMVENNRLLAENSRAAMEAVAKIQTSVASATLSTLDSFWWSFYNYSSREPKTFGSADEAINYGAYLIRSANVNEYLRQLHDWTKPTADKASAPWTGASEGIGSQLNVAVGQAEAAKPVDRTVNDDPDAKTTSDHAKGTSDGKGFEDRRWGF